MRDPPDIDDLVVRPVARFHGENNHANSWGGRTLLSKTIAKRRATAVIIDTPMFTVPQMFRLSFLFAANDLNAGTPTPIEFSPLASVQTKVTVRHGIDPRQGTIDDVYNLSPAALLSGGQTGVTNPVWMPISYITSRKLTILAEVTGDVPNDTAWIDFSCTTIDAVDTEQIVAARGNSNIYGWPSMVSTRTAQNSVTAVELLPAHAARRQFFVTNEGTARLALGFGQVPDLTAGAERFDVILDAKGGAYPFFRSGKDEHWGRVMGLWAGAGAGFAMATETDIFG